MEKEIQKKIIGVVLTLGGVLLFLLSVISMSNILLGIGAISPIYSRAFLLSSFVFLMSLSCLIMGIEKFKGLQMLEEKLTQAEGRRAKEDKFALIIIFLIFILALYLVIDSIAPLPQKAHLVWAFKKFFQYFFPLLIPFLIPFVLMYLKKK